MGLRGGCVPLAGWLRYGGTMLSGLCVPSVSFTDASSVMASALPIVQLFRWCNRCLRWVDV